MHVVVEDGLGIGHTSWILTQRARMGVMPEDSLYVLSPPDFEGRRLAIARILRNRARHRRAHQGNAAGYTAAVRQ